MRKLLAVTIAAIMVLSVMPAVLAISTGTPISPDIITEDFAPEVWMCDSRDVVDDYTEPGRIDGELVWTQELDMCECVYETCLTACIAGQVSYEGECSGLPCFGDIQLPGGQFTLPQVCATYCEQETLKFSCPTIKGPYLD